MKIVIVGAGVSGLSAGIFALKAGYEVEIYEKNNVAGGCCSSWKRGDFTIDNCIHWLTGTKKGTPQYNVWKELGVIKDDEAFIQRESFYTSEYMGQKITLWRDLERTRKELLELSPEDEKEITRFIECVKLGEGLQNPTDDPAEKNSVFKEVTFSLSRAEILKSLFVYSGISIEEFTNKIKHPLIKKMAADFMSKDYEALWLPMAYSFFVAGNGDIPKGGSKEIADRLVATFKSLGGRLYLSTPVKTVSISDKKAKILKQIFVPSGKNFFKPKKIKVRSADGVILENDSFVPADYIICTCDIHYTYYHLLGKKYLSKPVSKAYVNRKKNIIYSSFQVAFAVDGEFNEIDDTLYFDCDTIDVGMSKHNRLCVKNYRNYGDYIAPAGKTVIQCSIIQYRKDSEFWIKLHENPTLYSNYKNNIATAIKNRIETKFPQYEGKLKILDIWTPYSYSSRNHCHMGAYMRFITKVINPRIIISSDVKKLSNVYLASHWLRYPGGLPTAATMGKVAVDKIVLTEKEHAN